jgi:hypothetical protein
MPCAYMMKLSDKTVSFECIVAAEKVRQRSAQMAKSFLGMGLVRFFAALRMTIQKISRSDSMGTFDTAGARPGR